MDSKIAGHLSLGSSGFKEGGTLIDTWKFIPATTRGPHAAPYEVRVFMRKSGGVLGGRGANIDFEAKSTALPDGSLTGTDLQSLRQQVESALAEQAALGANLTWEPWLEVVVRDESYTTDKATTQAGLSISYRPLLRGRSSSDPEADFTINVNGYASPFPKPKKAGEGGIDFERTAGMDLKDWKPVDGRERDAEYSYVPDTPQMRDGIDRLMGDLQLLRSRLSDFLAQDKIDASVLQLGTAAAGQDGAMLKLL